MGNEPPPIDGIAWRGLAFAAVPSVALWWVIFAVVPATVIAVGIGTLLGIALELATREAE